MKDFQSHFNTSYFDALTVTKPSKTLSYVTLLQTLQNDPFIDQRITELRDFVTVNELDLSNDEHKKLYQNKKQKLLPLITWSGTFSSRANDNLLSYNFQILLDFDDLSEDALHLLWNHVRSNEGIFKTVTFAFISPGGKGIKVSHLLKDTLNQAVTTDNVNLFQAFHLSHYLSLESDYATLGFVTDENCKDIARACYLTHVDTETLYINDEATAYSATKLVISKTDNQTSEYYTEAMSRLDYSTVIPHINKGIEFLKKERLSITSHYPDWLNLIFCLKSAFPKDVALDMLKRFSQLDASYDEKTCVDKFNQQKIDITKAPPLTFIFAKLGAVGYTKGDKAVKVDSLVTIGFLKSLAEQNLMIRYDIFKQFLQRYDVKENKWQILNDHDIRKMYTHYGRTINQNDIIALLESFVPEHDPIAAFINALPTWDKQDHIAMLSETIISESPDMTLAFLKKWLVAFFHGLLESQGYNENVFVLQGEQNIGKTRWVNKLCQPFEECYEKHNINPEDKDDRLQLCTSFVVFMDEMTSVVGTQNNFDAFKQLLSSEKFNIRPPYGRMRQEFRRKGSLIGAINRSQFLRDVTGNRRWWIVPCDSLHFNHNVDVWQVWAQAYHLYKSNYQHWFVGEEYDMLMKHNSQFEVADSIEEYLIRYVTADTEALMTATEVVEAINYISDVKIDLEKANRVGMLLSKLKFEKGRRKGKRGYHVKVGMPQLVQAIQTNTPVIPTELDKILSVKEAMALHGLDRI